MAYSLAQVDDRPGLIVMSALFSIIIVTVVALRFYSRKLRGLDLKADDWLIFSGLILVLGLNGLFIAGTAQRVITGHSPVVNDWPVSTETEHNAERYKYAFQVTEKIAFGLIKVSIILLWRRIFGTVRGFNIACWTMIGIVVAWSLSFFFGTVFQCDTNWYLNWAPIGDFLTQCVNTLNMLTVFAATDILTDLMIIAMPMPMIWSLHMPKKKKVAVTGMFMVGFFTIGAGIARCFVYLVTSYQKQANPDFIQDFTIFLLWSLIEANLAIISACLPTLLPVLTKLPERWNSLGPSRRLLSPSWLTSRNHPTKLSDDAYSHKSSRATLHENAIELGLKPGTGMETTISTNTHNGGAGPAYGIVVEKKIMHQDSPHFKAV